MVLFVDLLFALLLSTDRVVLVVVSIVSRRSYFLDVSSSETICRVFLFLDILHSAVRVALFWQPIDGNKPPFTNG